jgi:hypothetical protein
MFKTVEILPPFIAETPNFVKKNGKTIGKKK